MIIETKLSGFDPKSFDPIPDGYYEATIVDVSLETASTGTEFLNVELEILGPNQVGRHVWSNLYLTEKARWKMAALVNAAGLGMVDKLETDQLIARKVRIRVKQVDDSSGAPSEVVGFRKPKSESVVPF
jgi:hypothetical protein